MSIDTLRMRKVFVPGGNPVHTYVPRDEHRLESQLRSAADNLCKLVTVTGMTKSGKSVLTQRIYPRSSAVWIDGGSIGTEGDFWHQVTDQLNAFTSVSATEASHVSTGIKGAVSTQLGIPGLAKSEVKAEPSYETTRQTTQTYSRESSPKTRALQALRDSGAPLVIDDFHYLEREIQGSVVRALKALVFDGHPVILVAIPHRRFDAVRVEREMTGRVHQIPIPVWTPDELSQIANLGFPLLNVVLDVDDKARFSNEALGSPHLMQEFCRGVCDEAGLVETAPSLITLASQDIGKLFQSVALDTSKTVFENLAKGPRQRTDRIQRKFKDGRTGDIYVAVLLAIASLRPGMATLEYEDVRAALRDLLEELPQAHEVSRVLDQMSSLQVNDESSAPVLDWESADRRLHITDPFFAFFLRWGAESLHGIGA